MGFKSCIFENLSLHLTDILFLYIKKGKKSIAADGCPDVFELENGDFAIIGVRVTNALKANLPESAGCGADEEIVYVPRYVLANAKQDIPNYEG